MGKKKISMLLVMCLLLSLSACSKTQPTNDNIVPGITDSASVTALPEATKQPENQSGDTNPTQVPEPTTKPLSLFAQDLLWLKSELPKKHVNLFSVMSEEEWNTSIDDLVARVDQLNDEEREVALGQIIASVGDAHTNLDYWDGYYYPLEFTVIDGEVYIISASKELENLIFSKVISIDGVDMKTIMEQVTTLIPHENDSWVDAYLPYMLKSPIYLYGLDLIKNKTNATFTLEQNGVAKEYQIEAYFRSKDVNFANTNVKPVLLGQFDKNYIYEYLADSKSLYFQYNSCRDMADLPFKDFNDEMFQCIEENDVERIILDVRNNMGGNSEVLNPFTDEIKNYTEKHPDVKVFILIGRRTFSGGLFAIYRTMDAAPNAIIVGEATGGALDFYGDILTLDLPKSRIRVAYSTQYFEFTNAFKYKNKGVNTCEPDVVVQPTIDDYRDGKDPVLEYVLEQ